MADPSVVVEIDFDDDGVFETDVSADTTEVQITRGRSQEGSSFQPGRLRLVLRNDDRSYDPDYVAGSHFGDLLPGKALRVQSIHNAGAGDVTETQFVGTVDSWTQTYRIPNVSEVIVEATDRIFDLANATVRRSVYTIEVEADDPEVWFRLGDDISGSDPNTDVAVNSGNLGVAANGNYSNMSTFGGSLVVRDPGFSMQLDESNASPQGVELDENKLKVTDFAEWSIELWVIPHRGVGGNATIFDQRVGLTRAIQLQLNSADPTIYEFNLRGAGGTTFTAASATNTALVNKRSHIVCGVNGNNQVFITVDGTEVVGPTLTEAQPNPDSALGFGFSPAFLTTTWSGSIAEIAIYTSALSLTRIATHNISGRTPWKGDRVDVRMGRVLDEIGFPPGDRNLDSSHVTLSSARLHEDPALDQLQALAESDGGVVFMARDGKVRFVARHNLVAQTSLFTFGDAGSELPYRNIELELDRRSVVTKALVTRLDGIQQVAEDTTAPIVISHTLSALPHDSDTHSLQLAETIVEDRKTPENQITGFRLGPVHPDDQNTLYPAMLGLELMDLVTVKRRPQGVGDPIEVDVVVGGITHSARPGVEWTTTLLLEAEPMAVTWETYSPTNANITVGDGTENARFARVGDVVFWHYELTFGSTTAFTGTVTIGLPVTQSSDGGGTVGAATLIDANGNDYSGSAHRVSAGAQCRVLTNNIAAGINATTPFTWATGDILTVTGSYEAL